MVYSAGVRHAYNVAQAFRDLGLKAQAVSGETPKRELAQILARYEHGDIDVLVNAQLLAEGWNSPRATVCMHLAPTASKRIYQQRVGRVTRRHQGKEAGIVVDFVHPATKHDDPVVTLHSLLDRDVYRGGAIVVGPVRRGRGRRLRVERRVLPVTADENRRIEVFERELWRIAVEHLDYGEQVQWAALAGARVAPTGWRRARAMLHFDSGGELKRTFLLTAVQRNKNPQLRQRALQEIAASRDAEAFDDAIEMIGGWPREEKREGVKVVLQALADKKIGRRDQANNWIWRCAEYTREVHEEYAVQRWPETKRLLGLLVNSSGGAHARNARRLVHAARQQDRRLAAALLAAAIPHTAEAGEVVNGARTRMSRKPAALARELLRNFPKGRGKRGRRRKKKGVGESQVEAVVAATGAATDGLIDDVEIGDAGVGEAEEAAPETPVPARTRRRRVVLADEGEEAPAAEDTPRPRRTRRKPPEAAPEEASKARRTRRRATEEPASDEAPTPPAGHRAGRPRRPPRSRCRLCSPPRPRSKRPRGARRRRPPRLRLKRRRSRHPHGAAPAGRRPRRGTPRHPRRHRRRAVRAGLPRLPRKRPWMPPRQWTRRKRRRRPSRAARAGRLPLPRRRRWMPPRRRTPRWTRRRRSRAARAGRLPLPRRRRWMPPRRRTPRALDEAAPKPRRSRRTAAASAEAPEDAAAPADKAVEEAAPKPRRSRRAPTQEGGDTPKPRRARRTAAQASSEDTEAAAARPKTRRARSKPAEGDDAPGSEAPPDTPPAEAA